MGLTSCFDCKRKISYDADTCPQCGCDMAAARRNIQISIDRELVNEGFSADDEGLKAYEKKFGKGPRANMYHKSMIRMYPDLYGKEYNVDGTKKSEEELEQIKGEDEVERREYIGEFKQTNWYSSRDEKIIWGVCAGIAHKMEKPVSEIRKYFLIGVFLGGPALYLIFALLFKQVNTLNDDGEIRQTDF